MQNEFNYQTDLILNPVENLPFLVSSDATYQLEGLYISDKIKDQKRKNDSVILFSGRESLSREINIIYEKWANLLHADALSMRLLSGLHAHIVTFMGIGNIGDKVMLLPTKAGGHYATKPILQRLGYEVIDMAVDCKNYCIDHKKTLQLIESRNPDFIFVDRSEGINYEDFSDIALNSTKCTIFDASQYLTHIITESFKSPFDMGFDFILSTLHKNFPGPQKAFICTKDRKNPYWRKILKGMSSYVSSLHAQNVFKAGDAIADINFLKRYADMAIQNSISLENELLKNNIPVIPKNPNLPATHHIWIKMKNREEAMSAYQRLEKYHLLANYRLLPYDIGYGLRLGTTAATLQGLDIEKTRVLGKYIANIIKDNGQTTEEDTSNFIKALIPLT